MKENNTKDRSEIITEAVKNFRVAVGQDSGKQSIEDYFRCANYYIAEGFDPPLWSSEEQEALNILLPMVYSGVFGAGTLADVSGPIPVAVKDENLKEFEEICQMLTCAVVNDDDGSFRDVPFFDYFYFRDNRFYVRLNSDFLDLCTVEDEWAATADLPFDRLWSAMFSMQPVEIVDTHEKSSN